MKMIKIIFSTVAMIAATMTAAQARDSFSIGINIGGHGHARHSISTHHHASSFRDYYGAPVVYYDRRPVVYYEPSIRFRYNQFTPYVSYGRQFARDSHRGRDVRRGHSRRGERHHSRRGNGRHHGRR